MAKLLYVTCNVASPERSRTLSLGNEFLESYLRHNRDDEVHILDLYRDHIPRVDVDVLIALEQLARGEENLQLTDEERRKLTRLWRLAEQFARCDKYVFVTHSLNLWLPAEFKMYVDAICVPGCTYRVTVHGAESIVPAVPRKSLHVHANPPFRVGREVDGSVPYLRSVLNFFGVSPQETVLLRGDRPDDGDRQEYEAARRDLSQLARRF
ncbi:FMN-dependent NADH-azoreductase [Geomonas sp. Red276]